MYTLTLHHHVISAMVSLLWWPPFGGAFRPSWPPETAAAAAVSLCPSPVATWKRWPQGSKSCLDPGWFIDDHMLWIIARVNSIANLDRFDDLICRHTTYIYISYYYNWSIMINQKPQFCGDKQTIGPTFGRLVSKSPEIKVSLGSRLC